VYSNISKYKSRSITLLAHEFFTHSINQPERSRGRMISHMTAKSSPWPLSVKERTLPQRRRENRVWECCQTRFYALAILISAAWGHIFSCPGLDVRLQAEGYLAQLPLVQIAATLLCIQCPLLASRKSANENIRILYGRPCFSQTRKQLCPSTITISSFVGRHAKRNWRILKDTVLSAIKRCLNGNNWKQIE